VKQLVKAHSKGVAGGTSTGSTGVSRAPAATETAVAEPEAAEAPADEPLEARAEAPAEDAPAAEPEGDAGAE
jgi:hypothetical protein